MLLILFALAQPAAGPAPAKDPELVVVAERLRVRTHYSHQMTVAAMAIVAMNVSILRS